MGTRNSRSLPIYWSLDKEFLSKSDFPLLYFNKSTFWLKALRSKWKWPEITGFEKFEGHKCHSASWDNNFDYSNKTVAVIGNGSSGVQIIPQLARLPNTNVVSFQRSPNFVYTPFTPAVLLGRDDPSSNPEYSKADQDHFSKDADAHRDYRKKIVHFINTGFTRVGTHF